MPKRVQFRRGTTSQHTSFTGAVGEITVDTTKNTVVVHNGSLAGGFPLAKEVNANLIGNASITGALSVQNSITSTSVTTSSFLSSPSLVATTVTTSNSVIATNVIVSGATTLSSGLVYTTAGTSNAYGTRTTSNTTPSGGSDGDLHFQY